MISQPLLRVNVEKLQLPFAVVASLRASHKHDERDVRTICILLPASVLHTFSLNSDRLRLTRLLLVKKRLRDSKPQYFAALLCALFRQVSYIAPHNKLISALGQIQIN